MKNKKLLVTTSITLALLLLIAGAFYWYQVRPAKIKHDCSWVTTNFDKVPTKPAKTEDEVFAESKLSKEDFDKALKLARREIQPKTQVGNVIEPISGFNDSRLKLLGENMIKQMQGSPEIPARDETRQATAEEYSFCLHDKGL